MEAILILRDLWRRRATVVLAAVAAVIVGVVVAFRVSMLPPGLESRGYEVGIATVRMLVDTPTSQVVEVSPKGSDTLGTRASLLSNLMTDGRVEAAIAQRAGLRPKQLVAMSESGPGAQPIAPKVPSGRNAHVLRTRVLTNTVGDQLPIVEVEAQAPDATASAVLADAAVTALSDYLNSKAATDKVPSARRLQVSALGPAQVSEERRGPTRLLGLGAAVLFFFAGCAIILLVDGLPRRWRQAAIVERGPIDGHGSGSRRLPLDGRLALLATRARGNDDRVNRAQQDALRGSEFSLPSPATDDPSAEREAGARNVR